LVFGRRRPPSSIAGSIELLCVLLDPIGLLRGWRQQLEPAQPFLPRLPQFSSGLERLCFRGELFEFLRV
jgi:hypothetical protein